MCIYINIYVYIYISISLSLSIYIYIYIYIYIVSPPGCAAAPSLVSRGRGACRGAGRLADGAKETRNDPPHNNKAKEETRSGLRRCWGDERPV